MAIEGENETNLENQTADLAAQSTETVIETNENQKPVYGDDDFIAYAKSKGRDINSFDEAFAERVVEKEIIKEVNPYEGVEFDEDDLQYIKFKKETNRSRKDFDFLSQDVDSLSPIQLAKQRIEKETGLKFTIDETKEYLEEKFDIDLSDEDLSTKAKIELQGFIKPIKDDLIQQQEKYKQPIEIVSKTQQDVVTLDNGTTMSKERYNEMVDSRNEFLDNVNVSVDGVSGIGLTFTVDDNGTPREVDYNYDFSQEDRHSMLSIISDVDATIAKRYRTEKGFNTEQFAVDMFFSDPINREKALSSSYHKGRADATEELMKMDNNVNFQTKGLPSNNGNPNVRIIPIDELLNR
ncbi:hypothetical protein [Flavobacterium psychrophilum]|uniref:Uncharacterized protein n=1 Tax=Flavobacterium psychrophilum TaxID=96345 RepID=A0A7U2NEK4_FLAPS|nr:hypothetical protein [Flavobacterium psychrophilum]QRE03508.1 hypothetical protein H0H26_11550 [Flavobacterium psychrophilum]